MWSVCTRWSGMCETKLLWMTIVRIRLTKSVKNLIPKTGRLSLLFIPAVLDQRTVITAQNTTVLSRSTWKKSQLKFSGSGSWCRSAPKSDVFCLWDTQLKNLLSTSCVICKSADRWFYPFAASPTNSSTTMHVIVVVHKFVYLKMADDVFHAGWSKRTAQLSLSIFIVKQPGFYFKILHNYYFVFTRDTLSIARSLPSCGICPSFCPCVRLSVCHTPVLCLSAYNYRKTVLTW